MSNIYNDEIYENKKDNSDCCYRISAYIGRNIKDEIYYDYEFNINDCIDLIKLHHREGRKINVIRSRE